MENKNMVLTVVIILLVIIAAVIMLTVTKKEDTVKKEEPKKEVTSPKETKPVKYNYDIGNCDKLYDSEAKAYAAAEAKFNDFSDPDKYVSNYMVYSTYDKWSINYYYERY